jgi:hypothetical protein
LRTDRDRGRSSRARSSTARLEFVG